MLYAIGRKIHATYNEAWVSGEIHELEYWLKKCGVDLSYERIEPMICGEQEIQVL